MARIDRRSGRNLRASALPAGKKTPLRSGPFVMVSVAALLLAGCVTPQTAEKDYETRVSEVVLAAAVDAERNYDYESAVRHFETLYERDKTNPNVVRDLARNLRYFGLPKQAITLLTQSTRAIGRKPMLLLELAKAQLAASEINDAHETLVGLEQEPSMTGNWQYHLVWGIYHDRMGNFAEAQSSYRQALALSPENVAVKNNLALSYAMSGELDRGVALLQKIIDDEAATRLTRQNLALLYGIKGDLKEAQQLARQDLSRKMVDGNLKVYREFHEE